MPAYCEFDVSLIAIEPRIWRRFQLPRPSHSITCIGRFRLLSVGRAATCESFVSRAGAGACWPARSKTFCFLDPWGDDAAELAEWIGDWKLDRFDVGAAKRIFDR